MVGRNGIGEELEWKIVKKTNGGRKGLEGEWILTESANFCVMSDKFHEENEAGIKYSPAKFVILNFSL